jgi:hypothetical protein
VQVQQAEVVVTPGAGPAAIDVFVRNASRVVEAYRVTAVNAPPWLVVAPAEVRLLPGADETVQLGLGVREDTLPAVSRSPLRLRIQAESDPALRRDVDVDLVVAPVRGPVLLRLEPSVLRAHDSTTALFRLLVDNRQSNEPLPVTLSGRDPEQEARFSFSHPRFVVAPASANTVRVRVDVPLPPAGEQRTRSLTVVASDGRREFEATGTFLQLSSPPVVDPPVLLSLNPSVVRVRNASSARTVAVADNRRGSRAQHLRISAADDENAVQFVVEPAELVAPAGQVASASVGMRAPRPDGGRELSRSFTVSAWDGVNVVQARGTFVQSATDRRPLARVLLTLLGAFMMVVGVFQPWTSNPLLAGNAWNVSAVAAEVNADTGVLEGSLGQAGLALGTVNALVNAGSVVIVLALVALFGLTGRTGRLTRMAALLCLVFVVAFVFALTLSPFGSVVQVSGQVAVVMLGCVVAFTGGLLAKR